MSEKLSVYKFREELPGPTQKVQALHVLTNADPNRKLWADEEDQLLDTVSQSYVSLVCSSH